MKKNLLLPLLCFSFWGCIKSQPIDLNSLTAELDHNSMIEKLEKSADEKELKENSETIQHETAKQKKETYHKKQTKKEPYLKFNFKKKSLSKIINKIAAKKGINIILPQGAQAIKSTVTFHQKKKIPLSLAEKYLHEWLNAAGYAMVHNNGFYTIVQKNPATSVTHPLHLYINIPVEKLPQSDQQIRAIYYLSNFRVPKTTQGNEPLNLILKDLLDTKKGYLFDPQSNGIILTGSANKIASAMTIILELDKTGSPEVIEKLHLYNATATTVAKLLNDQIIAKSTPTKGGKAHVPSGTTHYFSPNTKIVADPRDNALILLGSESAVNRIRDFVREFMDQPTDSGRSILHVYDLQYLDSKQFAQVLQQIVKQSSTGQSQKGSDGPNRMFEDVIVIAEEEQTTQAKQLSKGSQTKGKVTVGGNRLIVAAKNEDWKKIEELIEQLDKPQLQVIIEVMILDITVEGRKLLEAQTRNPQSLNLHENVEFQTAHMRPQLLDSATPTTLAADLLRLTGTSSTVTDETSGNNSGSMLISLNDGCKEGIWSVLKVLDKWVEKKVISHPFLVTKNNIKASEFVKDIRRDAGGEKANSGVSTVLQEDFIAQLAIEVTPRISSMERLNLQIRVDVEDFLGTQTFNRTIRSVETNANMGSGQILVLGGLTKTINSESETRWPVLSKIPIIGSLFKGSQKSQTKNNLAIFIHPTIVNPKLRAGIKKYTDDKIEKEFDDVNSSTLFASMKDPITRFFFKKNVVEDSVEVLNEYLTSSHYKKQPSSSSYAPADKDNYFDRSEEIKKLFKNTENPLSP